MFRLDFLIFYVPNQNIKYRYSINIKYIRGYCYLYVQMTSVFINYVKFNCVD